MNKLKTTFIRASLKNSMDNLNRSGIAIETLSRVNVNLSNGSISYETGNVENEILLFLIANSVKHDLDKDAIQKIKAALMRDAKMVSLCLAYLPLYGKGTRDERIFADEWRRMEREITLYELTEMEPSGHDLH